jgi:general secretion pathway protein G
MIESKEHTILNTKPCTSKLAVASFIMGLVSLTCVLWPLVGLPAIICGIIALVKISGSGGSLQGKGYAIAGIVIPAVMTVLIFVLAIVGSTNFIDRAEKARAAATQATLRSLHEAVNMFNLDTGRYPIEEEGLNALIKKPSGVEGWIEGGYLGVTKIPQDAWKHDFVYKLNPGNPEPVIISYGADGKEGGQGDDADLRSTDE